MRIGVLCHDSIGGSTRVATELALGLAGSGHTVHVFAYSPPFGLTACKSGVAVHTVRSRRSRLHHPSHLYRDWSGDEIDRLVAIVVDVATREGLDVLHFHYAVPYAEVVARVQHTMGSKCPVTVGTLHGTDVTAHSRSSAAQRARFTAALRKLDVLTTVSVSHAEVSVAAFDLSTPPRVISNFVDTERYSPRSQRDDGDSDADVWPGSEVAKVLHVSNFRPVKRTQDVVRIFMGVHERVEAELWLVGDGEAMPEVQCFLESNGLAASVRYWGLQPDIAEILPWADLLLITSEYESFSLAALEAMACGVPVLATDVGGLPEVVGGGGVLFPLGDCEAAVELAWELLSKPEERRKMSEAGRTRALNYRSDRVIAQYEDLYRELLTGAR